MLGLGLSEYLPYAVYGASFVAILWALLVRAESGLIFLASLLPVYAIMDKVLKLEMPMANNVVDFLVLATLMGLLFQNEQKNWADGGHSLPAPPASWVICLFMGYSLLTFFMGLSYLGTGIFDDMAIQLLADWKNYMIMPVLYFLAYYTLRDRRWKYVFFILVALSLLAAEYKFRRSYQWFDRGHYEHTMRIGGTFGFLGPNEWGSFHAIYTLFIVGLFIMDNHLKRRIAYATLILGGTYALMYSYSRGAYIGLVVGIIFITVVKKRILLIPLVIFALTWKMILPVAVVERIENTIVEAEDAGGDITVGDTHIYTAGRGDIWEEAVEAFSQNPITGTGFRTFRAMTGKDTHNQYLKTVAEEGIIGLFIYFWLYWMALKSGWKVYKRGDEQLVRAFGFGFVCAVVGSMVVNFFGDRWSYLQLAGIYWILWALVDQESRRIDLQSQAEGAGLETEEMDAMARGVRIEG